MVVSRDLVQHLVDALPVLAALRVEGPVHIPRIKRKLQYQREWIPDLFAEPSLHHHLRHFAFSVDRDLLSLVHSNPSHPPLSVHRFQRELLRRILEVGGIEGPFTEIAVVPDEAVGAQPDGDGVGAAEHPLHSRALSVHRVLELFGESNGGHARSEQGSLEPVGSCLEDDAQLLVWNGRSLGFSVGHPLVALLDALSPIIPSLQGLPEVGVSRKRDRGERGVFQ